MYIISASFCFCRVHFSLFALLLSIQSMLLIVSMRNIHLFLPESQLVCYQRLWFCSATLSYLCTNIIKQCSFLSFQLFILLNLCNPSRPTCSLVSLISFGSRSSEGDWQPWEQWLWLRGLQSMVSGMQLILLFRRVPMNLLRLLLSFFVRKKRSQTWKRRGNEWEVIVDLRDNF